MSNFEALKLTLTQGMEYTEASEQAMLLCFKENNVAASALAGISRITDEVQTANSQIISSVTTAETSVSSAYNTLRTDLRNNDTTPDLLATAATINEALGSLSLAGLVVLASESQRVATNSLARVSQQKSQGAAKFADVAWANAYDAADRYETADPHSELAVAALAYKTDVKSLHDTSLGKLAAASVAIAEMPDAVTLLQASNGQIITSRDNLEDIRDQALIETSNPNILARNIIDRLEGVRATLRDIIATQQPAQAILTELHTAVRSALDIQRDARLQTTAIRQQPPKIIDMAKALIRQL